MSGLIKDYNKFTYSKLPSPYIERIYILSEQTNSHDENTSDGVQVDIAVFLPAIEENNNGELIEPTTAARHLSDLNFYAVLIVGNQEINKLRNKEENIFTYVKQYDPSEEAMEVMFGVITEIFDESYMIKTDAGWYTAIYNNFSQISFADFSEPELIETEEEENYYKYTASMTIPMYGSAIPGSENATFDQLFDAAYSSVEEGITYKDANVYVFSSVVDMGDAENAEFMIENKGIVEKLTSPLNYESVFEDGKAATGVAEKWQIAETIVDTIPIQTLDGKFHESGELIRQDTVDIIYDIIPEATETEPLSEEVQNIRDSLVYLIETEKHEPTLLLSLNEYRKTFPNKDNTTSAGRIYDKLTTLIASENKRYKSGATVIKKLIRSFKIIDAREDLAILNYEAPEIVTDLYPETDWQSDRIYEDALITRHAYSSVLQSGESSAETWEQEDSLLNYGFIWFDFEKALKNDTTLATIFNIDKLETYFGKSFTSQALKFKYHTLARYYDGYPQYIMETYYKATESNPDINYMKMTDVSDGSVATINYPSIDIGLEGTADHSYCMLRNFDLASTDDLEGYRLACFQFQDYEDLDSASDTVVGLSPTSTAYIGAEGYGTIEAYSFYLVMQDQSEEILSTITDSYYSAVYEDFQSYYDTAHEFCSYNNIEGYFNEFFVNAIQELYVDTPTNSPWYRIPIIYNIHRDLLYNYFEGDMDSIIENSQEITDRISPKTGNLIQVQEFKNRLDSLWTEFYADESIIAEAIESTTTADPERAYYQRFLSLPAIYYGGETEEDYEADIAEIGTGTYVMDAWSSGASYIEYELTEEEVKEEILSIVKQLYPIDVRYSYRSGESSYTATYNMSEVFSRYYVGTATTADWSDYYDNIDDREGGNEYTYYTDTSRTEEIDASEVYTLEKELAMLAWPNSTSRSWGLIAMKSLLEDNGYTVV